jgi:hypothetical protein
MLTFKSFFEKHTVLSLVDKIEIEGIGVMKAMADSGNSAYNVLDARDVKINNNKVTFITTEKNIPVEKDIVETIKIHIGSNITEDRPMVIFDIKYNNSEYKNVQFSLADRSGNDTPVLLGREFFDLIKNTDKTNVLVKV